MAITRSQADAADKATQDHGSQREINMVTPGKKPAKEVKKMRILNKIQAKRTILRNQ